MVSHLLPSLDAAPTCAEFTRALDIGPAGTGLAHDRVVLVSVPLPWPKPALGHEWLKPAAAALAKSAVSSRLFAAEPWSSEPAVEVYQRDGLDFERFHWPLGSADDVAGAVEGLTAEIAEAPADARHIAGVTAVPVTVPTVLVCTQASHDMCCGVHGQALADVIAAERESYRLRRVSHTGGHRFAPTLLTMPGGRMWAFADLELVDRAVVGAETTADLSQRCRGWLGAATGVAQVAELAARVAARNPLLAAPVVTVEAQGEGLARCRVQVADSAAVVDVKIGREVPSIACGSPGGLPAKTAKEYEWTIVESPWN